MATDFYWTLDADLGLAPDGDLRDTSYSPVRSTWQEARTRTRSDQGDWAIHPNIGANLGKLLGRLNNRTTAEEGKVNLIASISRGGFIPASLISVKYIPLTRHWLLYRITIGGKDGLSLQLLYDSREDYSVVL